MCRVTFSDEVLVYTLESPTHEPSTSHSLQPSENMGATPRRPSPPEYRPSAIPSIRPLRSDAVPQGIPAIPSPQRSNQVPRSFPSIPHQSFLPPSISTHTATSDDQNAASSRLTLSSHTSSTREPFNLNKTLPPDENIIIYLFKDICYGHDDCIGYEVPVSPSSLLLEDEIAMYKSFPATEPSYPLLTIEVTGLPVALKVQAGDRGFVTVWDVLDTVFQHRGYLGDKQFRGLTITADGLRLRLHLVDIGAD